MATSEVKNLTGRAVRDSHVKLFIAFEPHFLSGNLNLGGLATKGLLITPTHTPELGGAVSRTKRPSIMPVQMILHHFPSVEKRKGRKLPIYLAETHEIYQELSKCPKASIACVGHIFFDDGTIQTMYVSPMSYTKGTKAVDRVENYAKTVRHELTHYAQMDMITRATLESTKTWFVEGLASYVAGESSRMNQLVSQQRAGKRLLSFEELQRAPRDIYTTGNVGLFYQEGYSIIEMLVETEGIERTRALTIDTTQQEDFNFALDSVLGLSPGAFDEKWRRFVHAKYGLNIPRSEGNAAKLSFLDQPFFWIPLRHRFNCQDPLGYKHVSRIIRAFSPAIL